MYQKVSAFHNDSGHFLHPIKILCESRSLKALSVWTEWYYGKVSFCSDISGDSFSRFHLGFALDASESLVSY